MDPPTSLPSGIFSVLRVTVSADSGAHGSACGDTKMKGPPQTTVHPAASFARGDSESQRGKETDLPKVAKQVEVNMAEST